jgi:hypothetical protein
MRMIVEMKTMINRRVVEPDRREGLSCVVVSLVEGVVDEAEVTIVTLVV